MTESMQLGIWALLSMFTYLSYASGVDATLTPRLEWKKSGEQTLLLLHAPSGSHWNEKAPHRIFCNAQEVRVHPDRDALIGTWTLNLRKLFPKEPRCSQGRWIGFSCQNGSQVCARIELPWSEP